MGRWDRVGRRSPTGHRLSMSLAPMVNVTRSVSGQRRWVGRQAAIPPRLQPQQHAGETRDDLPGGDLALAGDAATVRRTWGRIEHWLAAACRNKERRLITPRHRLRYAEANIE